MINKIFYITILLFFSSSFFTQQRIGDVYVGKGKLKKVKDQEMYKGHHYYSSYVFRYGKNNTVRFTKNTVVICGYTNLSDTTFPSIVGGDLINDLGGIYNIEKLRNNTYYLVNRYSKIKVKYSRNKNKIKVFYVERNGKSKKAKLFLINDYYIDS